MEWLILDVFHENVTFSAHSDKSGLSKKNRNTGMGNGLGGMQGTRGMFTRIPGKLFEDSEKSYHFNIPGNVQGYCRECWRSFRGMLQKIPGRMFQKMSGNVPENSRECSKRFLCFKRIPKCTIRPGRLIQVNIYFHLAPRAYWK